MALYVILGLCGLIVVAVRYWPAGPPAAVDPEAIAQYEAEIADFIARSEAASDSIAAAKAARQAGYAAQRAEWDAQRQRRQARYANVRDNYNRYPDRDDARSRYGRRSDDAPEPVVIDFSIPMPTAASLDPNAVDSATLLRLGLDVKTAARWLKYRRAGGKFREPGDIAKLYGLADTTVARLLPYFETPEAPPKPARDTARQSRRPYTPRAPVVVEVNAATEDDLVRVYGIGDYTAMQITDYRQRLGGFVSERQLLETPGLRDSVMLGVIEQLRVDPSAYRRRIRVNHASSYDEWRHPYLTWKQAKVIVANREQHGAYRQPEDLLRVRVISREQLSRLQPYLDFEP